MNHPKIISLIIALYIIGATHGVDKYTDENRPYEFGFTIDGEQHRHEKKDENGIIMGEFGFITADGVYHVTVYATDENGRFKILSMKNIRVKPYPTASVKKGHSLPFPSSENAPVIQGPSKSSSPQEHKTQQTSKQNGSPAKSCSHCSLPTTTTKAPQLTDIAVISRDRVLPNTPGVMTPQINSNFQNNQQRNQPLPNSSNSGSLNKEINNFRKSLPASGLPVQNISPSLSSKQNNPHYQNSYSHQEILGNQQNYGQQEHVAEQNYQQNGFSDNLNSQESFKNKPSIESSIDIKNPAQNYNVSPINYPQQNNGDQYSQNGNKAFQNNPQLGHEEIESYPQNSNARYPHTESNDSENYSPHQVRTNDNNSVQQGSLFNQPKSEDESDDKSYSRNLQVPHSASRNPKQYSATVPSNTEIDYSQGFGAALASQVNQPISNKPTLVAAQMQIVSKDTNIYHKRPGEKDGLPDGISKNDVTQLLYTFNYTVGFHGHHEEGYTNGAKQGYYFVTGRNGVRTRIDYIADEKGFRPKISQEVLDILSDDVPKPETERDAKFGLKGYEFKWLYYPTDDNKKQ